MPEPTTRHTYDPTRLSELRGEPWRATYKESTGWLGITAMWWIVLAVVGAIILLGYTFGVRPAQLAGERIGNQQSQQYEATQIASLRTHFETVRAMDREIAQYQAQPQSPERDRMIAADMGQRQNAISDMRRARDVMPDQSKVPSDIAGYLAQERN